MGATQAVATAWCRCVYPAVCCSRAAAASSWRKGLIRLISILWGFGLVWFGIVWFCLLWDGLVRWVDEVALLGVFWLA